MHPTLRIPWTPRLRGARPSKALKRWDEAGMAPVRLNSGDVAGAAQDVLVLPGLSPSVPLLLVRLLMGSICFNL